MCAAWNSNKNEKTGDGQKWALRYSYFARPLINYVAAIVTAPIELIQRLFYRPNASQDELVVEDLNAKFKQSLNENYIACFSQKMHNKPAAAKLDPRRTYDNLDACQSGTFKIVGDFNSHEEEVPELQLIDEIEEQKHTHNIAYLPSPSLSDSQIMRARPALSDAQIMNARRNLVVRPLVGELAGDVFVAAQSGTYETMPNVTSLQAKLASNVHCSFTQSGVYQLVEPDINPLGLQQFIEAREEKSA